MDTSMRKARGFTLLELIMVISIVGILAAVGTASFKYLTTSNRIATEINGLLGDMQFARSQAIKIGTFVSVCPSTDSASCTGSATWGTGWIVFLDYNGNGTFDSGTDKVLRVQGSIAPDTLVGSDPNFKFLTFNREGFGTNSLSAWTSLTLNSSPTNVQWRRCMAVSAVGALTIVRSGQTTPPPPPITC
jgi:type IV fimbrial biogenesis protein FimT